MSRLSREEVGKIVSKVTEVYVWNELPRLIETDAELREEVEHVKANYDAAVHGRREFRLALREARAQLAALRAEVEQVKGERDEARLALADAAMEINCAGPVAHRIRVLKETHATKLAARDARVVQLQEKLQQFLPKLIDNKQFEQAPCYLCGYNGPNYYQPDVHFCAKQYQKQQAMNGGG